MSSLQKQSVGIDISMSSFQSCVCRMSQDQSLSFSKSKQFENTKKGFIQLMSWVKEQTEDDVNVVFLMEATGVYYEALAYFLHENEQKVHVILPNKSKNYFLSLNVKTKTDKVDAKYLGQFGAERNFPSWQPPAPFFKQLRSITRYYAQLQEQKTVFTNMLHSSEISCGSDKLVGRSNRKIIKHIEKQIEDCRKAIIDLINSNADIKSKVEKICSIDGIAIMTAATIIAETLGFHMFKNNKQLVSYSGYDVVEHQSGTSISGKARISKKGNKYIRKALYFPALVSVRRNKSMKTFYTRIFEKRYIKMVSYVAVQRKLLILIYTLWKNNEMYDPKRSSPNLGQGYTG